ITCWHPHLYGLLWWEQVRTDGAITFVKHEITGSSAEKNKSGVQFSQPHAMALADIDGDGLLDIVTGKRFWAHGPTGDVEPNAPAVLYWFQLMRDPATQHVEFVPHLIDDNSGIGTQFIIGQLQPGKHRSADIAISNKKGTFVFLQETKPSR